MITAISQCNNIEMKTTIRLDTIRYITVNIEIAILLQFIHYTNMY
jgi:hypothetical protein